MGFRDWLRHLLGRGAGTTSTASSADKRRVQSESAEPLRPSVEPTAVRHDAAPAARMESTSELPIRETSSEIGGPDVGSTKPAAAPAATQTASQRSQPPRPALSESASKKALVVGLDYGTSSTKVVVWDQVDNISYWVEVDAPMKGVPSGAAPSTVSVVDGRTYFGVEAEKRTGGERYRATKMCLACAPGTSNCRGCQCWSSRTPEIVASAFLAWVCGTILQKVEARWPGRRTSVSWNLGAPLSEGVGLHDGAQERRRERFRKTLFAALGAAEIATQGVDAQTIFGTVQNRLSEYSITALDRMSATVIPEPLAPIMAFKRGRFFGPGLYIVIDIGAGSTEVSVFRHLTGITEREVFYADSTELLGGDDIVFAYARSDAADTGSVFEKGRFVVGDDFGRYRTNVILRKDDENPPAAVVDVIKRLWYAYRNTWGAAYAKEMREAAWHEVKVVLVGGGAIDPDVRRCLDVPAWRAGLSWRAEAFRWTLEWFDPGQVLMTLAKERRRAALGSDARLFTVALGLSSHALDYPDFDRPDQVPPVAPAEHTPPPDHDDRYPR